MTTWADKYDRAAQDFLAGEHVEAAVQVGRAGGWLTLALAQVWGLGMLWSMRRQKQRAARLPQIFLLAATDEHIVALGLPKMSTGYKPRAVKELRRWDRAAVRLTTKPVLAGTGITISGPGADARMQCQGPRGELTDRFVAAATRAAVPA